ncbi:MAG TPA: YetF domain-containing protein [Elusimicrobiota bacterium]|nr:YetF domain-containing protein [Elusimicrobiota bacterium]
MWKTALPAGELILRALVVYAVVLGLLRLAGKRQVGQMGAADLVALLLLSNAVQNAMNGGDNSLLAGVILAAVLIFASRAIAYATFKSRRLEGLIEGRPTLLVYKGEALPGNLDKELLSMRELKVLLRRQGIHDLHEIHEAILESDGMLSVVKKSELPRAA